MRLSGFVSAAGLAMALAGCTAGGTADGAASGTGSAGGGPASPRASAAPSPPTDASADPDAAALSGTPAAPSPSAGPAAYIGNDAVFDLLTGLSTSAPKSLRFGAKSVPEEVDDVTPRTSGDHLAPDRCEAVATWVEHDTPADVDGYTFVASAPSDSGFAFFSAGELPEGVFDEIVAGLPACRAFTTRFDSAARFNNEDPQDVFRYDVTPIGAPTVDRVDVKVALSGRRQVVDDGYDCLQDANADGPLTCMYDFERTYYLTLLRSGATFVNLQFSGPLRLSGSSRVPWPTDRLDTYAEGAHAALRTAAGE